MISLAALLVVSTLSDGFRSGFSVGGGGDVNGDGFADFAVGVYEIASKLDPSALRGGYVVVFSGHDGAVLHKFEDEAPGFGAAVRLDGDLDGDGKSDVIVAASLLGVEPHENETPAEFVRCFSGRDGSVLFTLDGGKTGQAFGAAIASRSDVDRDSFDDVLVCAPLAKQGADRVGMVRVHAGKGGATLFERYGSGPGQFAASADFVGDTNADSYPDVAVGDPGHDGGKGRVVVLSGKDFSELFVLDGEQAGDAFGTLVAWCGDANADGSSDVLVGIPGDDEKGQDAGCVRIYSGRDKTLLGEVFGEEGRHLGGVASGAGDVNGDGFDDLVVGDPADDSKRGSQGSARVLSGRKAKEIAVVRPQKQAPPFALAVARAGDTNQDGFDDVLVAGALRTAEAAEKSEPPPKGVLVSLFNGKNGKVLLEFEMGEDGVLKVTKR